jgi:squalene synthase HpnC
VTTVPVTAPAAAALGLSVALPPTIRAAFEPMSDVATALAFTRNLTGSHYENFSVVSFLLPGTLKQDFCNVYAFCRVADDLGDEVGDRQLALRYLADFRRQTEECYAGTRRTAVFVALAETIGKYDIPIEPFLNLISAFEQDQTVTRYETWEQVLDYCRRSADPVGRLVLYMSGYRDEKRQALSDRTCTALQLANFWQDVRRDIVERDRVYLPREDMEHSDVSVEDLRAGIITLNYRSLIKREVDRTQLLFAEGRQLLPLLKPRIRPQITLFGNGGEAILRAIRRKNYDTLSKRPRLSKAQKLGLMLRAAAGMFLAPFASDRGSQADGGGAS